MPALATVTAAKPGCVAAALGRIAMRPLRAG